MSIADKTSRGRRAALAAVFVSGGLVAALGTPSPAAPVLVPVGKPITVGTPISHMVTIAGHVPDLVAKSTLLGALPSDQALSFSISLPLRNQAALNDLVKGQGDPNDSRFGQFLTPQQFGAQFGRTSAEYAALIAFCQSKGLTVTQTWPSRAYLSLSGTTAQVKAAFSVTVKQFQDPDGRIFHSPDTEVVVPDTISPLIGAVVGLDDASPPKPLLHVYRHVGEAPKNIKVVGPMAVDPDSATPDVQNPGEQGTGPFGGFAPTDFRTAYGLNATKLNGAGQTTAIIEYGTTWNIKDTLKYEAQFGLTRVPITIIAVDGGSTTYATDGPTETDLDIDMHLSMSPNLAGIRMYLSSSTGADADPINKVATDNIAKQVSISYGFGAESRTGTTPSATSVSLQAAYLQCATEGISVYVSTGDSGSQADSSGRTSIDISSDEPAVTAVGGTALTVVNPGVNETYSAESAWNYNNTATGGADGGGVSTKWTIAGTGTYAGATYQANAAKFAAAISGSNVSATQRNVPDISCDASPETGAAVYVSNDPGEAGNAGPSLAAPVRRRLCGQATRR